MKVITQRDMIQCVADKFHDAHSPFFGEIAAWKQIEPRTKRGIWEALNELDKSIATSDDVANIMGNESWTRLTCDQCKHDVDCIIQVGDVNDDFESPAANLCKACLQSAYDLMFKPTSASS